MQLSQSPVQSIAEYWPWSEPQRPFVPPAKNILEYAKVCQNMAKVPLKFRTLEVHLREVDVDVRAVRRVQPHAAVKIVRVTIMARVGVAAVS